MDQRVVLNYGPGGFGPDRRSVPVGPGDRIVFHLGEVPAGAGPGCRLKITLDNAEHFSPKAPLQQTDDRDLILAVAETSAAVLAAAAHGPRHVIATYKCELFDGNGNLIGSADGATGGEIVPGQGGGAVG